MLLSKPGLRILACMRRRDILSIGLAGALAVLGGSNLAAAQDANTFKGKTVTIYIGFAPGGGYDFYGRLASRHLGKHIPGNPTVVAQNMPGAGSFQAANYLFHAAPKDGTALGVLTQTIALEEAFKSKGVQYRSADYNWIGRITAVLEVTLAGPKSRAKTIEDVRKMETPVASTGSGSPSDGCHRLLNALGGTQFKIIAGYGGSSQTMLATESGEVDASSTSWNTLKRTKADMLKSGEISVLVQYASERHPDLPNVPAVVELGTSPEASAILGLYASSGAVGRAIAAPPGVSPERVKILRVAFDEMLKDPEFLAEVDKLQMEFQPASGEYMQSLIADTAKTSPALIEKARVILQQ
jgi:tripartite-type tricarboxylate transporter receptor subunit TctC